MKRTLKYSFSLLAVLAVMVQSNAQDVRVRGPRISYDLASLTLLYFDPDRMVYTVSMDYELKQDFYACDADLGYQHVKISRDNYNYASNGMFARIGADINLLNYDKQVDVYEMLYVGGRYGISLFSQQADNIDIPDGYWGDYSGGQIEQYNI